MVKIERHLNSKDVAHILDLCPDDVVAEVRKGRLIGIKQGRYWKFRLEDVDAYKRKHTATVRRGSLPES